MQERLVFFPFSWTGTATGSGSAEYVTTEPLAFHSGGIYCLTSTGGSARVSYTGTAQGTAQLKTESNSGSCYIGTTAFGTAPSSGGTAMCAMRIPANGTIRVVGTASAAGGIMYGYAAFLVEEFGGTAYPAGVM